MVSVVFASAWIESFLGQLTDQFSLFGESPKSKLPSRLRTVAAMLSDAESQRAQLSQKLDLLSLALRQQRMPRNTEPFQSLDLLLALRNKFVHMKSEKLLPDGEDLIHDTPAKIARGLR